MAHVLNMYIGANLLTAIVIQLSRELVFKNKIHLNNLKFLCIMFAAVYGAVVVVEVLRLREVNADSIQHLTIYAIVLFASKS